LETENPYLSLYASIQYFDMGKNIKGKVVALHALAVYSGSRYTTLLILNHGIRWR
jgi:hypothetical protein